MATQQHRSKYDVSMKTLYYLHVTKKLPVLLRSTEYNGRHRTANSCNGDELSPTA